MIRADYYNSKVLHKYRRPCWIGNLFKIIVVGMLLLLSLWRVSAQNALNSSGRRTLSACPAAKPLRSGCNTTSAGLGFKMRRCTFLETYFRTRKKTWRATVFHASTRWTSRKPMNRTPEAKQFLVQSKKFKLEWFECLGWLHQKIALGQRQILYQRPWAQMLETWLAIIKWQNGNSLSVLTLTRQRQRNFSLKLYAKSKNPDSRCWPSHLIWGVRP